MGVEVGSRHLSRFREPSVTARLSFCRAFGVAPDEQVTMEKRLTFNSLTVEDWTPELSPWESDTFSSRPGLTEQYRDQFL
jgi:hypothetical protein